ncbi:MAG: hypothetical protein AAF667_11775 [Pseudomonadota bacterium]
MWNHLSSQSFWHYGFHGDTTPWYPTMRLFRQPAVCDWATPVEEARDALLAHLRETSG